MKATGLVVRLMEIEQSLGTRSAAETHDLVLQAEDCALEMERQLMDVLRENERLRQRMEKCDRSSLVQTSQARLPESAAVSSQTGKSRPRRTFRFLPNRHTFRNSSIYHERKRLPMSSELITALDRVALNSSIRAGTLLFRSGDSVSAVFLIRAGELTLELTTDGGAVQLDPLGPGQIVGLPAALNGSYSLTARAADDSELGYIPATWVIELLNREPELCLAASKIVAREAAEFRSAIRKKWKERRAGGSHLHGTV